MKPTTSAFAGVVLVCACFLLPVHLTAVLNTNIVVPIPAFPKENVTTGNKILYEQTGNDERNGQFMEVNEIPVRYDEAQLWRIYNISMLDSESQLANTLENRFGGNIWKENSKFLDISFEKQHLKKAKSFLRGLNISSEVLNGNIQNMLDEEEQGYKSDFNSARAKKAIDLRRMNWNEYHDLDVIYDFLKEMRLAYPDLCRLYTIGKTAEGRELKVMRISENPKDNQKIWIDGGIHAREWISPASVTYILYNLLSNWSTLPSHMTSKTWYVMPVMNPDGYRYSRKVNRLWRKNRSQSNRSRCFGVDLNRNFNINWQGLGSSTKPCADTYRGESAGSELETKAVVDFLARRKNNLSSYLTFHSYGQVITYPWAYKAAKVKDGKDLLKAAQLAVTNIKSETGQTYRAGATYELLGIAGGGSDDWSRAALGVKYVYTVELRDTGRYGFVLPKAQIKGTSREAYAVVDAITRFF